MYAIVIAHYKIEMDMGHGATRNRMLYFSTIQRLCWHCDEHDLETLISWSRRYPCKEIAVERSKTGLYPYILWQRNVSICVVENRQMTKKQFNRKFVVTSERCEKLIFSILQRSTQVKQARLSTQTMLETSSSFSADRYEHRDEERKRIWEEDKSSRATWSQSWLEQLSLSA